MANKKRGNRKITTTATVSPNPLRSRIQRSRRKRRTGGVK